jgi:hypothetical protein
MVSTEKKLNVNCADGHCNPKCNSEYASDVLKNIHVSETGCNFWYPYLIQRNNHDLGGGRAALHRYDKSQKSLIDRYYVQVYG